VVLATLRQDLLGDLEEEFLKVMLRFVFPGGFEDRERGGLLSGVEVIYKADGRDSARGAREMAGAARGLLRSMELRGVTPS
jgi:hypothetical protein